ncbi:MAG: MBL fold metallo-hydrolase [Halieaceae bacterium]
MKGMGRVLLLALTITASWAIAADEPEQLDTLIDQLAAAYGGDAFAGISGYQITERYMAPASGQSWSPALVDIGRVNQQLVHDLDSGKLYFENWFVGRAGVAPAITVVNGDDAWAVNLRNQSYGAAASADPYVIAGGTMRTTDTLLARELLKSREQAEYLGGSLFMNRQHAMVKMPFPQSPDLTLYIDTETHLISRMTRDNPQLGLLDYVFNDHRVENGIARAGRVDFSVAGDPNLIGADREISFRAAATNNRIFELPTGLEREGERIVDTEMQVNRLAANVYHVGQNGGYSIFVDTGSEVIACGGYAGLSQRFDRFQSESGSHRPLRYQVVSHHHQDHLGGVDEALSLGATLVTVEGNIEPILDVSKLKPESGRFLTVNQRMTLGSGKGRVELYDVSTVHANSNLLFYVPATRTLFMADHFGTPYAEGVPVASRNTVSMEEALQPLDINFNKVVTAHGARVFSSRDFTSSVKAFRDYDCPEDRPLCSR